MDSREHKCKKSIALHTYPPSITDNKKVLPLNFGSCSHGDNTILGDFEGFIFIYRMWVSYCKLPKALHNPQMGQGNEMSSVQ